LNQKNSKTRQMCNNELKKENCYFISFNYVRNPICENHFNYLKKKYKENKVTEDTIFFYSQEFIKNNKIN